ncbi:acyl-CoA thioesterase-1 [Arthrobacter sp. CAN_A6]|uniref:SGNH/GDSL hydrolase family protein n=1 Tax=Arthrobacter sp. CAN_A6 TaxID=2787721 RepID=UPI0018C9A7B5
MRRTGPEQRRAAMTAGASFVAGALLVATAAVGSLHTTGSDAAGATTGSGSAVDITSVAYPGPGTDSITNQAPLNSTSSGGNFPNGASGPGVVAAGPHDGCRNPVTGGPGEHLADARRTALLIGDSQSGGAAGVPCERTWTQTALRNAGYDVQFLGAGGTGFVASNGDAGAKNYPSALQQGQWVMPCTAPALIVVEGGGNDATQGASDEQILGGADRLMTSLTKAYPTSKVLMVGTLARGADDGGARRSAVDGLLGSYAYEHNIAYISVGDWLTTYQVTGLMADGVHLAQAGHDRLAVALADHLHSLRLAQPNLTGTGR